MPTPELRVHGVSGTPPRDMLYTDPLVSVLDPPEEYEDKHVRVYELPGERLGVSPDVTAFHWGSLTSGSWVTALWVLLLPFSFANVAGWTAKRRGRWQILTVRLFGLFLTGVFINLATVATVDFYWQWVTRESSTAPSLFRDNPNLFAGLLFLALGWVWYGLVSWASTRSHFSEQTGRERRRLIWKPDRSSMVTPGRGPQVDDEEAWIDPARKQLTDPLVWDVHPILHRLRRIHFGFGFLVLAFSAAAATNTGLSLGGIGLLDVPTLLVMLALVTTVATLIATGWTEKKAGNFHLMVTAWQSIGGGVILVLACILVIVSEVDVDASTVGHWPHLRDTSAFLLIVCVVALVAVWFCAGRISASAVTLGVLFGVIFGAAIAFMIDDVIGDETTIRIQGLNWAAVIVLVWLLFVALVAVWLVAAHLNGRTNLWEPIHDTTGNLHALWVLIPGGALVAAVLVALQRCDWGVDGNLFVQCIQDGSLPEVPAVWIGVLMAFIAVVIVGVVFYLLVRIDRITTAVLLVLGTAGLVVFLIYSGFSIGGIDLSFAGITETARTVAIIVPAGLIITRMISGLRGDVEARRGMGVIWDVIMFWPRWFHPMAPPSYGPHAIKRLREQIDRMQGGDSRTTNDPVIVSSHSQGTVITVTTLGLMGGATRTGSEDTYVLKNAGALDRLGLLTYGCPVRHLYDNYFPSLGYASLSAALADGLDAKGPGEGRWANLYRLTDPIGGPVLDEIDCKVVEPVDRDNNVDGWPKESVLAIFIAWLQEKMFKRESDEKKPVPQVYRGHSKYEPITRFIDERDRIKRLL